MAEKDIHEKQKMAQPLEEKRLEAALDVEPFLSYAQKVLTRSVDQQRRSTTKVAMKIRPTTQIRLVAAGPEVSVTFGSLPTVLKRQSRVEFY
ncbi:hypothetical protein quinque_015878 [Culex quinquefasciatus]